MIKYKGYTIKKSKVLRNGYLTILKNNLLPFCNSESYNVIKGEIRLDIERGKI